MIKDAAKDARSVVPNVTHRHSLPGVPEDPLKPMLNWRNRKLHRDLDISYLWKDSQTIEAICP